MSTQMYCNNGRLAAFILRRDRVRLLVWLVSVIGITLAVALSFTELYPTAEDRAIMAETMRNPAMTAMVGPGYGLDNYTEGAMFAHEMLLFTAIAVAVMNIFLVVRHTRKDEERGRLEVVRSLPVGRLSNLSATLMVAVAANILLALVTGVGLASFGIESIDWQGSLLFGAALGATGIFFAAATALFVQLSENSRGATGYSFAFLMLAYLVRAVGDVSSEPLSWFSPFGWILRTEAFVNNRWLPLVFTIGMAAVVGGLALYLNAVRDLEAGLIPAKPGRKYASALLQSPGGLTLRLLRATIIAWAVGMFVLGASYGSVLGDLESFFETNEMMKQILPANSSFTLTEQFITMLMSVLSMICAIPVLQIVVKLKGEEKRNHTEHLLARSVSRTRLLGGYAALAFIVSFVMQFLAVLGLWSAGSAVMTEPVSFGRMFGAAMVYLPALWVMTGAAVLLIGVFPKGVMLTWLYLGYSFFTVYLGPVMKLPDWTAKLSPFGQIPKIPVEDMDVMKLIVLTATAVILLAIGFVGYRKRDMQG